MSILSLMQSRGIEKKCYERKKATKNNIWNLLSTYNIEKGNLTKAIFVIKVNTQKANETFMCKQPMKEKGLLNTVHEGKKPYKRMEQKDKTLTTSLYFTQRNKLSRQNQLGTYYVLAC